MKLGTTEPQARSAPSPRGGEGAPPCREDTLCSPTSLVEAKLGGHDMLKLKLALCAAAFLALSPAKAQEAVDVAKAKSEGKVSWYTSTPIEQAQKISALFKQQTGIEVELFRSGGSAILSRF